MGELTVFTAYRLIYLYSRCFSFRTYFQFVLISIRSNINVCQAWKVLTSLHCTKLCLYVAQDMCSQITVTSKTRMYQHFEIFFTATNKTKDSKYTSTFTMAFYLYSQDIVNSYNHIICMLIIMCLIRLTSVVVFIQIGLNFTDCWFKSRAYCYLNVNHECIGQGDYITTY